MAQTANELLHQDIAVGFDAPLNESPAQVYTAVKKYMVDHSVREALLLVDMGSLTSLAENLEQELGIKAKSIPLVSTLHVLNAVRKSMLGCSLLECYEGTKKVDLLYEGPEMSKPGSHAEEKLYILTACSTGEGSAEMMKELLNSRLSFARVHAKLPRTLQRLGVSNLELDGIYNY